MSGADTIFALSSGAGPAGVAVVRISGPAAGTALQTMIGRLPVPRYATLARVADIDTGLALWFPAPRSETGEDMAELQVHGGRAVVSALLAALAKISGCRLAEPGEFTRRAFDHGKLDLTAVEGLADLVHADTEAQRRQALRQMRGELAALYDGWRARLIKILALLEADIDFGEEDLPPEIVARAMSEVDRLAGEIVTHLDDHRRGERLRDGFSIVILGPPNAGKSSLLNWLARRDAAIVAATAGTTRDVIEVQLDLGGYPVVLADTAGLRQSADAIESEGIRRALDRAARADLKLVVLDANNMSPDAEVEAQIGADSVVVLNKIDLLDRAPPTPTLPLKGGGDTHSILLPPPLRGRVGVGGAVAIPISVKTGEGLDALLAALTEQVAENLKPREAPALTRLRHREALEVCRASLARATTATAAELRAEDIRLAARALGRITGRVDVEDVLDVVFREFCIGK